MQTTPLFRWLSDEDGYSKLGFGLLITGLVINFFCMPFVLVGDGMVRYQFMKTLLEQQRISFMSYPMLGPLFSLPLWWLSSWFAKPAMVVERYNLVIFILFLAGWFALLRSKFDFKFLFTLLIIISFGSMFPGHLLHYYGEVFSAICLTLGTTGLALGKNKFGWFFMILAVLNTQALIVPFSFVVFYKVWETRRLRYLVLIAVCVLLMVGEAYLRAGDFVTAFRIYLVENHGFKTVLPYSGRNGYSYPLWFGLLSVLFSFGKGLVFFCPGFFALGLIWKDITDPVERKLMIQWVLVVIGLILVYSTWWAWYGGDFWGPRFFLFASIPASWVVAKLIQMRQPTYLKSVLVTLLVVWSLWVGVNGVVFQQRGLSICSINDYALEYLCWFVPEFSALLHPFITHKTFSLNDRILLVTNAVIWIYVVSPFVLALVQPSIEVLRKGYGWMKSSAWKI